MTNIQSDRIFVLFVDDDDSFVELAVEHLERADDRLTVTPASDTAEGLEILAEQDIDCIVADYKMGERTGIEFLDAVRRDYPNLPFIVYTGKGSEEIASTAIATGVTDYIRKGFDANHYSLLANRIKNAVESYRARQAIQATQREYERILERITDGFFSVDTDWRYTYVNEEGAQLVGRSPDEMIGNSVWEVFPDLSDTPFEDALRQAMHKQESTDVEAYYSPQETWFAASIYPDDNGISIYFRPIDERKQYEQTVSKLHEVANDLARMDSPAAICQRTVDAAEDLLEFDLSVIALEEDGMLQPQAVSSGVSSDDFEAMSIHEGIAGKTYRTGEAYLIDDVSDWEEANPQGTWQSGISLPVGEHGNFQAVNEATAAFDDADLQLTQLLITHTTDHLDRVANKQALERQNERLDEFASIVSHDLRNPLNVATGRLELATEECDSVHLEPVQRALDRMDLLIEDMLTLARQGESITDVEAVSLPSLIENCWTTVDTADATLTIETDRSVYADRSRLAQLFENMFRNAIEHGGEDVTVTVGNCEAGVFVEDDGPGIDPEVREKVFETGHSTKHEGTGFGLSIVQTIVDAHGWDIRVTEGTNGGARFEITSVKLVAE